MCGRVRCSLSREEVRAEAQVARWRDEEAYNPSYNAAPGRSLPVLKQAEQAGEQELHTMAWGLIPSYHKDGEKLDFFRMFNARSETVAEKGVFKKLLSRQRCVVYGVGGFYEWAKEGKAKQPYYIYQDGRAAMRMAGLFDVWRGAEGSEPFYSFTILTTDSSERLQWLHDRQPVILPDRAAEELWLSGGAEDRLQELSRLYTPYNGEDLQWHAVDPAMSKMQKDGPECCQPLKRTPITSFFKPKTEGGSARKAAQPAVKAEHAAAGEAELPAAVKAERSGGAEAEQSAAAVAPDGSEVKLEDVNDGGFEGAGGQPRYPAADAPGDSSQGKTAAGSPQKSSAKKRPAAALPPSSGRSKAAKADPATQGTKKITSFFSKS